MQEHQTLNNLKHAAPHGIYLHFVLGVGGEEERSLCTQQQKHAEENCNRNLEKKKNKQTS